MQTGVALRRRGQGQSPGVWMITTATACWFPQSCCRSWRGLCSEESNQLQFCLPDSEGSSESPHAPGGSREPVMPVISKMPPAWFSPICSLYSRLTVTSQQGWVCTPLRHCKILDKERNQAEKKRGLALQTQPNQPGAWAQDCATYEREHPAKTY